MATKENPVAKPKKKLTRVKSYRVTVPIYTTNAVSDPIPVFAGETYSHMVKFLADRFNSFDLSKTPIIFKNPTKTKRFVIDEINYSLPDVGIGDGTIKSVLVNVAAYSTNVNDGYVETDVKRSLKGKHKIGSNTYYFLLVPFIPGSASGQRYFIVLIYEDPTKDNGVISKICKRILEDVIRMPVENMKLPSIFNELEANKKVISRLKITLSSLDAVDDEIDVKYRSFVVKAKLSRTKTTSFSNIPINLAKELINSSKVEDYQTQQSTFKDGDFEYRNIKSLISEAEREIKEVSEKIFNTGFSITQEEYDNKMHDHDFIVEKLNTVLTEFISKGKKQ